MKATPTAWPDRVQLRVSAGESSSGELRGLFKTDSFPGQIALTFDDGPSPAHTPEILRILEREHVRATFYVMGVNAFRRPELVREAYERGHAIGNHSWDHPDLAWLTPAAAMQQIERTEETLRDVARVPSMRLLRPPYGSPFHTVRSPYAECRAQMSEVYARSGSVVVMWHIDSGDWMHEGRPELVVERFRKELARTGGGVVLMHDVHEQTVQALPRILDAIRESGATLTTDVQLLSQKYGTTMGAAAPAILEEDRD